MKDRTIEVSDAHTINIVSDLDEPRNNHKTHFSTKLEKMNALLEDVGLPKHIYTPNIEQQNLSFQNKPIRRILKEGNWIYNLEDVISVLTDCAESRTYWAKLKKNILETQGKISVRKGTFLLSNDTYYPRDAATSQEIIEMLPLVPSTKTKDFRLWLLDINKEI